MSLPFGWTPDAAELATIDGIDRSITRAKAAKNMVNQLSMRRTPSEQAPYIDELARIDTVIHGLKVTRAAMWAAHDKNHDQFGKAFRRCVSERFGDAVFRELCDAANARIAAYNAQPSTVATSRALDALSNGGGMKVRR